MASVKSVQTIIYQKIFSFIISYSERLAPKNSVSHGAPVFLRCVINNIISLSHVYTCLSMIVTTEHLFYKAHFTYHQTLTAKSSMLVVLGRNGLRSVIKIILSSTLRQESRFPDIH